MKIECIRQPGLRTCYLLFYSPTRVKVIGINTAVDGQAQNVGFATPIEHAADLIAQAESGAE